MAEPAGISTSTDQVIPKYGEEWTDAQKLRYFRQCYQDASGTWDPRWNGRDELYKLFAAESLDEASRQHLRDTERPPIDFPFVLGTICTVWGSDMAEQKEAVFKGDDDALSQIIGDWLTKTNRWDLQKCGILREEKEILFDLLIGGYGFEETFLDLTKNPATVPSKHVEIWEMLPDPDAVEPCLTDAKYFIRKRGWDLEAAQAKWPDKADELARIEKTTGGSGSSYPKDPQSGDGSQSRLRRTNRPGMMEIFDFPYVRFKTYVTHEDPPGSQQITKESQDTFDQKNKDLQLQHEQEMLAHEAEVQSMMEQHQQASMQADLMGGMPPPPPQVPPEPQLQQLQAIDRYPHRCIRRMFVVLGAGQDGVILEDKQLDVEDLPYQVVTGLPKKDVMTGRVEFFGLMRPIRDAQLYINKSLSAIVDAIGRGSKGNVLIEQGALVNGNPAEIQKTWSTPGALNVLADGAISGNKIQVVPAASIPGGIERLLEFCMNSIDNLSLVTAYLKGTAEQERSQVLVQNLQTQNIRGLAPMLDPLSVFRMRSAQLRTQMMVNYLPTSQLDKIVGKLTEDVQKALIGVIYQPPQQAAGPEEQMERQPLQPIVGADGEPMSPGKLLKTVNPWEFAVVVDIGQASPTSQQAVFASLGQGLGEMILNALTAAGINPAPFVKVLLRSLPLPGSQAVELSEEIEEDINRQEALQQTQGVIDAALQQGPDGAMQIVQQIVQALQQQQPQQGGQPPQGGPPN